jgi:hypothetical protein
VTAEHYTRNTETATCWCNKCNRMTTHRIDGGRKGPCLEHKTPIKPPKPKKPESGKLFALILPLCLFASVAHAQGLPSGGLQVQPTPAGSAPPASRVLADAQIGGASGLGYHLPDLGFGATLEWPVVKRFEAQAAFSWSPDRKYITNDGNEVQTGGKALFWLNRWAGLTGEVRYNRLWTSQFDKQSWSPSGGFVLRDNWFGLPGRFYADYVFPTGCQWATTTNPCTIQSNRLHGIEFFQEIRIYRHWRLGFKGAWASFANQGNPLQPMPRVWNNTGTVDAVIRYEFRAGSLDEAY